MFAKDCQLHWLDFIGNKTDQKLITNLLRRRKWNWLGHILKTRAMMSQETARCRCKFWSIRHEQHGETQTYLAKTRSMGLPYCKNFINLITLTIFVGFTCVTDGWTAGRAIAYSALSIYAIFCHVFAKNWSFPGCDAMMPQLLNE